MHALAHKHLHRFQIDAASLEAVGNDRVKETLYLGGGRLLDGVERFFSCADNVSGASGRNWQICALISRNSL